MEPERGFEPRTYHLRGGCSTTELLRRRLPSLPNRVLAPTDILEAPRSSDTPSIGHDAAHELERRPAGERPGEARDGRHRSFGDGRARRGVGGRVRGSLRGGP